MWHAGGCLVIGGSATEIIDEGVTGTVLEKGADAAGAVTRVLAFDRQAARATAVRRFSSDRMVDEYVAVYEKIVSGSG